MAHELLLDLSFLTEEERDMINNVISKDVQIRKQEQSRISDLRKELDELRENGLPEDDIESKNERYCARCQTYFGQLFNTGALCPRCQLRVCKTCRTKSIDEGWICTLCSKVREVKAQSGAWFFQGHKEKSGNLFGSMLVRKSLRSLPTSPRGVDKRQGNHHQPILNTDFAVDHYQNNNDDDQEDELDVDEYDPLIDRKHSHDEDGEGQEHSHNPVALAGDGHVSYSDSEDDTATSQEGTSHHSTVSSEKSHSKEGASDGSESLESDHHVNTHYSGGRVVEVRGEPGDRSRIQTEGPAKPNRLFISDLDDTDIFYTPAPKFTISNRRRTFTDEFESNYDESREQDALARDEDEFARDRDALARDEDELARDQDVRAHDQDVGTRDRDAPARDISNILSREQESDSRDLEELAVPFRVTSARALTNLSREHEERVRELEEQSREPEDSRDFKTSEVEARVSELQANAPSKFGEEKTGLDDSLADEAREVLGDFSQDDRLGNDDDTTASLPSNAYGSERSMQVSAKGEVVTQKREEVVESPAGGDEAGLFGDESEVKWSDGKRDNTIGVTETSEQVVESVLARVKNWEQKSSDFSPHERRNVLNAVTTASSQEASTVLQSQEIASSDSRNIADGDVTIPDDDVTTSDDDVSLPRDQYDIEVQGENGDVIIPFYYHEVQTSPDQDDEMISHDQDDEVISHDQDDEVISHDQDDEVISHDQDDEGISHDQDDEMIPYDQDDEVISHDQDDEVISHDQDDEGISHDQDDEMISHDQDDEVISHDQDDEMISHDQDDEMIPHDQDDKVISHDQDDEVIPHDDEMMSHDQDNVDVPRDEDDVDVPCDQDDVDASHDHDDEISHDQDDVDVLGDQDGSLEEMRDSPLQDDDIPSGSMQESGHQYHQDVGHVTNIPQREEVPEDPRHDDVTRETEDPRHDDVTRETEDEPKRGDDSPKLHESLESRQSALLAFSQTFASVPRNQSRGQSVSSEASGDDRRSPDAQSSPSGETSGYGSPTASEETSSKQSHSIAGGAKEGEHEEDQGSPPQGTPIIVTPGSAGSGSEASSRHHSIIEYEEDLDVSFAKYGAGMGNRSLKDQLSLGSRESIASYYSNAGGDVYGKYPVTGEIYFGLKYDVKLQQFHVQIHQAREITAVDEKNRVSDPYVKTYLLPDRSRGGKRKTKVKKSTINPIFDEILTYKISYDELLHRTLWLAIWNHDRFGHNDFLGEVLVAIDEYRQSGFSLEDPEPQWYHLCERQEENPDLSYNGEIMFAMKYVPPSAIVAGKKKKSKKKKEEKGELHINIIEATNLLAKDANGTSDPFCKSYLLPDKSKKTKQKTSVVKKNLNPKWNYQFVYDNVTHEELMDRVLELTVWDFDRGSSNEFLGGVRLGLGAGLTEWDDACAEEQAAWNKMLNNQNHWNQVTLTLRDHMGNAAK